MTDMLKNFGPNISTTDAVAATAPMPSNTEDQLFGRLSSQRSSDLKEWGIAVRNFGLVRDEVRADAAVFVASSPDLEDVAFAGPDVGDDTRTELTADDLVIEQAYMMAKRAVKIALETDHDPVEIIGSGTEVQEKAKGYVGFIQTIMANSQAE